MGDQVKPGQIWAECDPRAVGRTLRVERIEGNAAVCTTLTNIDAAQRAIDANAGRPSRTLRDMRGSMTRISLARFKPTRNGYRLLSEEGSDERDEGN